MLFKHQNGREKVSQTQQVLQACRAHFLSKLPLLTPALKVRRARVSPTRNQMATLRPREEGTVSELGLEPAPTPAQPTAPRPGSEDRVSASSPEPTSRGREPSGLCSPTLFSEYFLNTCSVPGAGGICPGEDVHLPPLHEDTMLNR